MTATATISVGHVLREAVAAPYRHLVTRPTGAAVRDRIEARLSGANCVYAYLDFSDIDLVDLSCADEVVAKLLLAARISPFVVLQGLSEDQYEAIAHVLTHHRLAAAAILPDSNEPCLLGWATPDSRAAFDGLREAGPLSAAGLAGWLGWSEARAREALAELTVHRVIRPDGDLYHLLPSA